MELGVTWLFNRCELGKGFNFLVMDFASQQCVSQLERVILRFCVRAWAHQYLCETYNVSKSVPQNCTWIPWHLVWVMTRKTSQYHYRTNAMSENFYLFFCVPICFLSRIFGPKRNENGQWRRLHNEELHSLYRSPNIVRVIKYRLR